MELSRKNGHIAIYFDGWYTAGKRTKTSRARAHERSESVDEDKKKARMKRAQRAALMNGVREQTISVTYDNKALAGLNEPWSNAACMGYCLMAMQQAGVPEPMQKKVLVCLEEKLDFYSLADAEKAGYKKTED